MTQRRRGPASEGGFSLVEMLVVLTIIAITAGASVMTLSQTSRRDGPETEARRLSDRLQLAVDESLAEDRPLALVWNAQGYRFLQWDSKTADWTSDTSPLLGRWQAMPNRLSMSRSDAASTAAIVIDQGSPLSAVFDIEGRSQVWRVSFDGFSSRVGAREYP